MATPPPGAEAYLSTLVAVLEDGQWISAFTFSALHGVAVHVITAWNPGNRRPSLQVNRSENVRLKDELEELGFRSNVAVGRDPHSEHAEESWAVVGMSDQLATEIGRKFDQVAVFRIEGDTQFVLGCESPWSVSRLRGEQDA